jgi:hypothetical protein
MVRGDSYRIQATAAEASAAKTLDSDLKRQYLELAERWLDLARQADEYEAFMGQGRVRARLIRLET